MTGNGSAHLPEIERAFSEAVSLEFAFLLSDFAYQVSTRFDRAIEYESSKARVTVTFDRGEMEVFVSPDAFEWTSVGYGVTLMAALEAETRGTESSLEPCATIQYAANANQVREGVKTLARCLRRFGLKAIQGDEDYFKALRAYSDRFVREWQREPRINHARRIADTLWHGKGYEQYLELMVPYLDQLTSEERERITIARTILGRD